MSLTKKSGRLVGRALRVLTDLTLRVTGKLNKYTHASERNMEEPTMVHYRNYAPEYKEFMEKEGL